MGLEAIERIEVIAAELAAEVFGAKLKSGSGPARWPTYPRFSDDKAGGTYRAACSDWRPCYPPQSRRCRLHGLKIVEAPVAPDNYTGIECFAGPRKKTSPSLITIGGSLNLSPPVPDRHL